ncbi:hypothetical protein, partial [Nitrosomonas sp.]|uniref:hypothetical protein n=1 Tax=Nitrosomonas sp. TaxID=42353 RepID=UPI003521436E
LQRDFKRCCDRADIDGVCSVYPRDPERHSEAACFFLGDLGCDHLSGFSGAVGGQRRRGCLADRCFG